MTGFSRSSLSSSGCGESPRSGTMRTMLRMWQKREGLEDFCRHGRGDIMYPVEGLGATLPEGCRHDKAYVTIRGVAHVRELQPFSKMLADRELAGLYAR